MTVARRNFTCDFEATTDPNDCRVWAYGYMQIGNEKNYKIGNDLDEFMKFVEDCQANLYFHNLKYDGMFIIYWLFMNGFTHDPKLSQPKTFSTIISNMGQWYGIDICYGYSGKKKKLTKIYDSLKKIPFPVKRIAKAFKLPLEKGDIDYHVYRPVGHVITDEEYKYIKNDVEIMAKALHIQFEQGMTKMTVGSDAYANCKDTIGKKVFEKWYPQLDLETDANLRLAYRGGFTWLNDRFAGKEILGGIVFDVNSLYPYIMDEKDLPIGLPVWFDGKYEYDDVYKLHIQHVKCTFKLKEGYIPTIQIKKNRMFMGNEYLKDSGAEVVDLYMTNVDLDLMFEHYEVDDIEYIGGYMFKSRNDTFNKFIEHWSQIKRTTKGAIRELAKLNLNSAYGKFGTNPDKTGKIPYMKEDGTIGFYEGEEDIGDPKYLPVAIFVTSWARDLTIRTAQKCFDRIIYCDTDSIHLTGTDIPDAIKDIIDPNTFGYWKYEYTFKRGKYIRQKTYYNEVYAKEIETEDGIVKEPCDPKEATTVKTTVKCAGMTDKVKENVTFENFEIGFKSKGKLLQKSVKGGVVLIDTEFTIKGVAV